MTSAAPLPSRVNARHTVGFSLEELADRLGAVGELDDQTFASYGLTDEHIRALHAWAVE
ncbi:hypothetical protein [Micromonospora sp. CPCC 205556]|uniref:hypothetical protein n=1 Tax=Micromonospora sp. CPCC 205556 TaxID=3122398 RepID=UPI002FF03F09